MQRSECFVSLVVYVKRNDDNPLLFLNYVGLQLDVWSSISLYCPLKLKV